MSVAETRGMGTSVQSKNTNSYGRQNWEQAEFPVLCETCLGDNPYVRMTKEKFGRECKICDRPFTIFRWCPGAGMRFKKTEICQTCSKLKNVCQTCLLDLEYGLPTQVRDAALGLTSEIPTSDVNREYYMQNVEKKLNDAGGLEMVGQLATGGTGKAMGGRELLMKLKRSTPYYKRNRAHICSFWVKGECRRGEECPYRHEMPTDPNNPLAKQNMKDRYFGTNDPVANKMMKRANKIQSLEAPTDQSIMSLYIGGVEAPFVTQQDLQDHFYQYGEVRVIRVLQKQKAAFVHFTSRAAAEKAAAACHPTLIIKGRSLKVLWGRGQSQGGKKGLPAPGSGAGPLSIGPPGTAAPGAPGAPGATTVGFLPPTLPAPGARPAYASMDPHRMGARSAQPIKGAHQKGQ